MNTKSRDIDSLPYRPCVGMMVLNSDGRVFVGQRLDTTIEAWQMPQGGVDEGEELEAAALRELEEEIGTRNVTILARTDDWVTYDLPKELVGKVWKGRYRGQKQHWFVMRFHGVDADINLEAHHPEFARWQWVPAKDLPDLIVPFKRDIYAEIVRQFGHLAVPA